MSTTVISARIDDDVKETVDRVLAAAKLSPSQLLRRVYHYIATVGDVPDFMRDDEPAVEGRGYVVRNELLQEILDEKQEAMDPSAGVYEALSFEPEIMKREHLLLLEQKLERGQRVESGELE